MIDHGTQGLAIDINAPAKLLVTENQIGETFITIDFLHCLDYLICHSNIICLTPAIS
jgi:hypothetical protein